jgi:hypothetical protein
MKCEISLQLNSCENSPNAAFGPVFIPDLLPIPGINSFPLNCFLCHEKTLPVVGPYHATASLLVRLASAMKFFDPMGNQIPHAQWVNIYRACYFCQANPWVEDFVAGQNSLLTTSSPRSSQDLITIMAWKTGHIDQWLSHTTQQIHYNPANWPANPAHRYANFLQGIQWLAQQMPTIRQQILANPQYLLNVPHHHLPGFGATYRLTVLFFITNGSEPIYDEFAHKAALAIDQDRMPWDTVTGRLSINSKTWVRYGAYKQLLRSINLNQSGGMFISRDDDRALWAYGHLFKG